MEVHTRGQDTMYIILVYDVKKERLPKIHKLIRTYLHWTQNSVFEGEINKEKLNEMIQNLKENINHEEDSIYIYTLKSKNMLRSIHLGVKKSEPIYFI